MKRGRSSSKSRQKQQPKKSVPANKKKAEKKRSPSPESSQGSERSGSQSSGTVSENGDAGNEVIFIKNTFIAFVDPAGELDTFSLGLVLEDHRDVDQEVLLDVYEEVGRCKYTKSASKVPIAEHCIIGAVTIIKPKGGKGKGAANTVTITQQNFNSLSLLMENVVSKLKDAGSGSSGSSSNESDEQEESEQEEDEEEGEKESDAQIKGRRIVAVKKPAQRPRAKSAAGKPLSKSQSTVVKSQAKGSKKQESQQSSKKQQTAQKRKSQGKKNKDDEDDEELKSPNEQSESALVQIRKSVGGKRGRTEAKRSKALTQVTGSKRMARGKLANDDSEGEEEEEDDDDEGPQQKRNLGGGKSKTAPKKKVQKMPTEFKKGKWNPDVELIDTDLHKEGGSDKCYFDCCVRCNNKNVIRAALTGNAKLLSNCIDSKKQISQLTAYWSPEVRWTALEYMVLNNEHDLLEILLHPKVKVPAHSNYENERNMFYADRAGNPQYLLNFVDSGMVSQMAYGARVRKVQMTRGNKQGNNAFLQYQDNYSSNPSQYLCDESFLKRVLYKPGHMSVETFQMLYKLNSAVENSLNSLVAEAVRAGNRKIAYEIVKGLIKFPNWGFNNLHLEALGKSIEQQKVLKVSVLKKANTNQDLTPLHCACINPDPKIIKQFLDIINNEVDVPDTQLRRPIHYAAANENPEIISLLIKAGAAVQTLDNQKTNCLHVAAQTGRAATARVILQTNPNMINLRTKQSMTPLAFACKYGHTDVVKVLFEFKAKINVGAGAERMTALQYAAAYGHYDLCEYLITEAKARVLGKDKYKRSALTMAVRNGHTKIASLLLQRGSEWDHPDSSVNTPLHYAAAYGWLDSMNLLLKTGADVNAQNSWRITPINIAMLKNHQGCVKRLLEEPNVDVNCKDEKGRTLLMLALYQLDEESESFIKYLLKKGANPSIVDLEGQTVLHYIAKYQPRHHNDSNGRKVAKSMPSQRFGGQAQMPMSQDGQVDPKLQYERQIEIQKNVAMLLVDSGVDLSHKDNNEKTAFAICLDQDNVVLLDLLKSQISFNNEPDLFFAFEDKIFDMQYQAILRDIIKNDQPTLQTINHLNKEGLTPFLFYIESFIQEYNSFLHEIILKVNQLSLQHNNNLKAIKITNKDLFVKFKNTENYHTFNPDITEQQKSTIAREVLNSEILAPFINILQLLIKTGADPQAQVQKLKKFRDEEIEKAKLAEDIRLNGPREQKEDDKVKKREEVLMERNRGNKRGYGKSYSHKIPAKQKVYSSVKEVTEIREGKKVVREYSKKGLRNAFHLIVECPETQLVEFLINLQLNPDLPDYDQLTPFNLISHQNDINGASNQSEIIQVFRQQLISLDVRIDYPDIKGRTPFLNYYDKKDLVSAGIMLDLGANVNQMDNSGLFALKYALIRRDNPGITYLLERGANINQIDNKGRNLLHHAVNMSSATADATFETEQFLIEKGVEINLKDSRGRTPLHYAFIKIGDWKGNSQIDPIETVSSLCGYKKLELDVADKWLKTPLHYASQRGASCCAMYLIQKGATTEKKDLYGNTPLGVCLLNHHYNYGILLIQNKSNVNALVYRENPEEWAKKWKQEALQQKTQQKQGDTQSAATEDHEMNEEDDDVVKSSSRKAHRKMFNNKSPSRKPFGNDYGDEDYGDEDYGDEEQSDEEDDYRHEKAFNNQNAFGINVYKSRPIKKQRLTRSYYNQNQQMFDMIGNQPGNIQNGEQPVRIEEKEGCSLFKLAIRAGQQGLAYLMMTNGYDLMLCIQDAMDEKKFMLVLTLLAKTAEDEVVQKKNNKNQNLFHILSMNSSACQFDHLVRIYQALTARGVDCKAKDIFKRSALHYAVISRSLELVRMLLTQPNPYDPNEVDIYGHSPLSLCLQGKNAASQFNNSLARADNIFQLLAQHGANVNFIYPEGEYKPTFNEDQINMKDEFGMGYDTKQPYKCTILINVVRQNQDFSTVTRDNILGLLKHGAKLSITDSDGRDAMIYAIIQNNEELVKMLIENQKNDQLDKNCQDRIGKSAAHYIVNPLKFGSYENVKILRRLHGAGYNLKLKDNQKRTPQSYAQEQESSVLSAELQKLIGKDGSEIGRFQRTMSIVDNQHWPQPKVDYDLDSEAFMQIAKEKEELEHKDKKIPVDKTGHFEKSYEVYYDENNTPWDSYLVKVDLKNGIYGDYVFYKMQLLYDRNRDLYVVFTRWGRIGEDGMNQRSPFNNVAEAKDDYSKIFKGKTGNVFTDKENFIKQKKKYNIAHVNYITTDYKDYLSPFDYEKCPRTRLQKEVYELFEEVSNITMYQRAMNSFGVDTNVLPFSGIKKEVIINAKEILGRIQEAVKEDAEISKAGIKADFEQLTAVKEKISQLSSEYYELVPLANYKNSIAPPLCHQHQIKQQYDNLENLTYIEYASKMLLGAVYRQNEVNPVDYVYHALNMLIEPLEKDGPEYEVIRTYIKNTRQNDNGAKNEIFNIYKIQRKGEAELMQNYKDIPNHLLLFHGSQMFNFLGILQQGLRIAPPEAPPTGYLFGKGVYFADMYSKSANYNYHTYQQQDSSLMLLCEVALGNQKEVLQSEYIEQLPPQYNSLKVVGRSGPDYDNMLILPNGTKIPYGKVKDYYAHLLHQQQQNFGNFPSKRVAGQIPNYMSMSPANVFGGGFGGQPWGQQNPAIPQFANNEYVVYNTSQIRMRYLIQFKQVQDIPK